MCTDFIQMTFVKKKNIAKSFIIYFTSDSQSLDSFSQIYSIIIYVEHFMEQVV